MKIIFKILIYLFTFLLLLYFIGLIALYFTQEKFIFLPSKLPKNFTYKYNVPFEEKWIKTSDNCRLNALLFKADSAKGIILYLHGNAGALDTWGFISNYYTSIGYDILIPDYRGFGKSTGKIYSQKQMYDDVQNVYNSIKKEYTEDKITILGYSIGTGPATYLASKNQPKNLVLLAPYYNLPDLANQHLKIIPPFVFKYQFSTDEYILKVKARIAIFHGLLDSVIDYSSSKELYKLCKQEDKLYLLSAQAHIGIDENQSFRIEFEKFLGE
jgi:fermentation-respiration switch protein FrsA (DUF1100 family)